MNVSKNSDPDKELSAMVAELGARGRKLDRQMQRLMPIYFTAFTIALVVILSVFAIFID